MEANESKGTQYLVPTNVSARFEIFEGIGFSELRIIAITLVAGAVLYFMFGFLQVTKHLDIKEMSYSDTAKIKVEALPKDSEGLTLVNRPLLSSPVRVFLFIFIPGAVSFFALRREPSSGLNLIGLIKVSNDFRKSQKRYYYVYGSEVEGRR